MKTRLLFFLVLIIIGISTKVNAYSFSAVAPSGQTLYYNITSSTAPYTVEVTTENTTNPYYTTYLVGAITIPDSITFNGLTYLVTSIGVNAFHSCYDLTSVIIPNSISSIGERAFENCVGLTSIIIPNSVITIGSYAFYRCVGLISIIIPNSISSIESYTFSVCRGLTSVTIPNTVTSIGEAAFSFCSGLTSVIIPNTITSIRAATFFSCSNLTSVVIPSSVNSIGNYALANCDSLKSIICENINPPIIFENTFDRISRIILVYVPCGSLSLYQETQYWKDFINYKCIVGLDDDEGTSVLTKIYPNPASDKAVLEIEGLRSKAEVRVMDLAGRIIGNYVIDKGENKLEIDVRRFAKGVYNVLVQNKEINISKKLVVE